MAHPLQVYDDPVDKVNAIPMFSKNGTALSESERERIAQKRGVCIRCGIKTMDVKFLKQKPLTSDRVFKGICIRCNQDRVPQEIYRAWEEKFRPVSKKLSPVGKLRAAARATAFAATHSPERQTADQNRSLLSSSRQVGGGPSQVGGGPRRLQHTSSLPTEPVRDHFDGSASMSAVRHSAPPAAASSQSQFDHATGSFRHSSVQQRSIPQFDGNMSMNSLRANLPERSQRHFDGVGSMREGMVSIHEDRFHPNTQHATSERLSSSRIEEEGEEFLSMSMPICTESIMQSRLTPSKKGSSQRDIQRKNSGEDGGGSFSWLNYDHDSARSIEASDYSGGESTESISELVAVVKDNTKNPNLLKEKLHRLRNLADASNEPDMIPILTNILNEYRNDSQILTIAVGALWSVTAEDDEKKIEAANFGAIDCIFDSLQNSHSQEDAEFCEWAIGTLSCLGQAASNREAIADSNGVESILNILLLHQASAGVFEWSCRALYELVRHREDDSSDDATRKNAVSIDENEGAQVIVCAMKIHHSEFVAQEFALMTILRLLDRDDRAAVNQLLNQINEADGIAACVKILKARSMSPRVTCLAAELTANLVVEAEGAKNSVALQNAVECIPSLVRVMKEHNCNENVQKSCCRLFAKLARIESGRRQMNDSKALVDIVFAMTKYTANLPLNEAASWALWCMSSFPSDFSLSYVKDALNALKTSTKEFPGERVLLVGACGFIANVCSADEANMSHVPVEVPIRALKVKDPTDVVDEQACRALTCICIRSPAKVGVVFEGGGVDSLVKRLQSRSLKASAAACKSLAAMADTNDEIRRSVVDAGALEAVVTLLGYLRSTDCLEESLELLSVLLAWENKRQSIKLPSDSVSVLLEKIESCCDTSTLVEKACDTVLNLLLATATGSKSLDLDGLVETMSKLLNDPHSPVEVKQKACAVLWALVTKQKTKNEAHLASMFTSIIAVMKIFKGKDQGFNPDLQSEAAGALLCISARIYDTSFKVSTEDIDCIIAVLYMTMEYARENIELLEKLLNVILNLSLVDESLVVQCGGVVVVVDAMADHEQEESILEVGCAILGLLASTEDLQVNLCIAETDGIDMIVGALASFPSNERIQVSACKAISHISVDSESRHMIVSQGGLMLLVNAMNSNREDVDLAEGALSSLLNLSSDTDEQLLSESNVIENVIEVMRSNPDVSIVQEKGLGVLQNLSMRGSERKKEIARLGGIKILVEAIRSFMGEPNVLERAFTAMWSLALLDSNQKAIGKAGGVELLVNGMMAQLDSPGVQKQACGCLSTLSTDSRNNSKIREADGVDAIVYAIWAHFDSEVVLSEACRALSSVIVDMHTNEVIIAQEGEVNAVISAMRCYPRSAKLQENACVALQNLLLSPESVDSVKYLEDEIRSAVSFAAKSFPGKCTECAEQIFERLK